MAQHNRVAELAIISFIMQSETLITGATIKILLIQLRSTKESISFLLIQFKPHYSSYRPFVSRTRRLGCWMFWAGAAVEMRYVPLMLIAWDVNKDLVRDDNRKKPMVLTHKKLTLFLRPSAHDRPTDSPAHFTLHAHWLAIFAPSFWLTSMSLYFLLSPRCFVSSAPPET